MSSNFFLCSDLDRTLLPNGHQEESPEARKLLHTLARSPEITLAYVSGRNLELLREAVETYEIPEPDYAVGDVGTTIYHVAKGTWQPLSKWEEEIAPDWRGRTGEQLARLFAGIGEIELQEPEKQGKFKLSYYAPADMDHQRLVGTMQDWLRIEGVRASLIWSVDEGVGQGLLDILPERATKYHAVRFLMERHNFSEAATVFAGDSGNDLPVLTSGLQAVLVKNAADAVRREAKGRLAEAGRADRLYCAQGGFLDMNGNYAAGVIEGLVHFIPRTAAWFK